ncbi:MAG: ankyrin repeat domain-containing protein [Acidimicrobiales bacterium]
MRALLADDPSVASASGADGVSAVRTARYRSQSGVVDALVAAGADLDVFDAAALGRTDRLDAILRADPGLVDAVAADGFTPLQLAAFFGRADAASLLVARGASVAPVSRNAMAVHALNAAAAGGHSDVVALLLDAGADPDARQHGGFSPLMSCAAGGNEPGVTTLLARGADPAARGDDGKDAATLAAEHGHPALAERLRALMG